MTQQDFLAWVGTVSVASSLLVMGCIPLYLRVREAILKAEVASRESRKADCEHSLAILMEKHSDLLRRIATLERECTEWQHLYDAGSKDRPKMG